MVLTTTANTFILQNKLTTHINIVLSNLQSYHRPQSISEALALLQKNSGTMSIIAGGTKLLSSRNDTLRELVDINGLSLSYIKEDLGVIRVGATTTLQRLVGSPLIQRLYGGVLAKAAQLTRPTRMIRNLSTMGGELVTSNSLSVLYCLLLALQAQVRIAGGEEFALAMNIFLNKKDLAGGLLMEILIPHLKHHTYAGLASIATTEKSTPVICACVRLSLRNRTCREVKIALTGTKKVPQRFQAAEARLEENKLSNANIEMVAESVYKNYKPVADALASQEYRKETCRLVVKKALLQCLESAEEEMVA